MKTQLLSAPQIILRDYQDKLVKDLYQEIREGKKKILVQLPTGGGKSAAMGKVIFDGVSRSRRILTVAHRTELLEQMHSHLTWAGIPEDWIGWIKSGKPEYLELPVQIASPQTWDRRWKTWKEKYTTGFRAQALQLSLEFPEPDSVVMGNGQAFPITTAVLGGLAGRKKGWQREDGLPHFDLILIDEAHHSVADTYKIFWELYPDAIIIGFTATPCRADGKGFEDLFDSLVCGPSVSNLIEQKHLSEYLLVRGKKDVSLKGLKKLGGEYASDTNTVKRFSSQDILGDAIATWKQFIEPLPNQLTVGFAIRCDHAELLAKEYNATGIPAGYLDGDFSPEKREETLIKFLTGQIKVLWQVGIFTEGFDPNCYSLRLGLPPADIAAVQVMRPIASHSLWLQVCGRALRPAPGKEKAYIIDHANCHERLGFPCDEVEWTLQGATFKPEPKKKCGNCNQTIKRFLEVCPICGFQFPKPPKEKEEEKKEAEPNIPIYWECDMEILDPKTLTRLDKLNIKEASKLESRIGLDIRTFDELCYLALRTNCNPWRVWSTWERYLKSSGQAKHLIENNQLPTQLRSWETRLRKLIKDCNERGTAKEWLAKFKYPCNGWRETKLKEFQKVLLDVSYDSDIQ